MRLKCWSKILKEIHHLENLGVDGSVILIVTFKEITCEAVDCGLRTVDCGPRLAQVRDTGGYLCKEENCVFVFVLDLTRQEELPCELVRWEQQQPHLQVALFV
jgi:hypothetical protein